MRIFIATAFAMLLSSAAFSQEQLGLRLENYAGVSGLPLNPTSQLFNPLGWDVNLVGGGVFFQNNYASLRKTNTLQLLRRRSSAEFILASELEGPAPANAFIVDFYNVRSRYFAQIAAYVEGPSVAFKIGEQHAVGLFTALHSALSSQDVPGSFGYISYDQRPFTESFSVAPFSAGAITWSEIGANYAHKTSTAAGELGLGINVRYLRAYEAAYVQNRTTYQHTKLEGDTITLGQPDGRLGYASADENAAFTERNGRGLAFDLGVTYLIGEGDAGYRLKLGASVLDLGWLRFNRNAYAHEVTSETVAAVDLHAYEDFSGAEEVDEVIALFSRQVMSDSAASLTGNAFTMTLPSALSVQADYAFTQNIFVNTMLVQRFSLSETGLKRGNLLAVTPRFEHRWFSASLPLSLYNYQKFQPGLALRLGFLVVGTDNLLSLIGRQSYTGTDFYFAVKVNPFGLGEIFGGGKRKFGKGGKVKCYDF